MDIGVRQTLEHGFDLYMKITAFLCCLIPIAVAIWLKRLPFAPDTEQVSQMTKTRFRGVQDWLNSQTRRKTETTRDDIKVVLALLGIACGVAFGIWVTLQLVGGFVFFVVGPLIIR